MGRPTVERHDDAATAFDAARAFLMTRPVEHNILLSILQDRIAEPEPGRYWVARDGADVVGFALQSPPTFSAGVAPAPEDAIAALVAAMVDDVPDLPGVIALAATAATFAGGWAETRRVPATPQEGGRIYRLGRV